MYYSIFQNYSTGYLWFKKFKSKEKQKRAVDAVVKLTNNSHYDNLSNLSNVKTKIKKTNAIVRYMNKY